MRTAIITAVSLLSCTCLLPLLMLMSCALSERNGVIILELVPRDSSSVSILDTITATLDYEYSSDYQDNDVILAIETLCSENAVGTVLNLDTLHSRSGIIDVKFRLGQFDELCNYSFLQDYVVMRFKLVLDHGSEYARVTTSGNFHYFTRDPL